MGRKQSFFLKEGQLRHVEEDETRGKVLLYSHDCNNPGEKKINEAGRSKWDTKWNNSYIVEYFQVKHLCSRRWEICMFRMEESGRVA